MNDLRWSGDASGNQPRGFKKLCLVALHKSGHLNTGLSLLCGQSKGKVFEKP